MLTVIPTKKRRSAGQKANGRRFRVRKARKAMVLARFLGFDSGAHHRNIVDEVERRARQSREDRTLFNTSKPLRKHLLARLTHGARAKSEAARLEIGAMNEGMSGPDAKEFVAREIARAKEADRVRRAPVVPCYTRQNKVVYACGSERAAQVRDRKSNRAACGRSQEAYANADLHTLISIESARKHRAVLAEIVSKPLCAPVWAAPFVPYRFLRLASRPRVGAPVDACNGVVSGRAPPVLPPESANPKFRE